MASSQIYNLQSIDDIPGALAITIQCHTRFLPLQWASMSYVFTCVCLSFCLLAWLLNNYWSGLY